MRRMATTYSRETEAQDRINVCIVAGGLLAFLGGILAGASWPRTSTSEMGDPETVGNYALFMVSLLMSGAGSMVLLVGLIGYGVMLGRHASPQAPR